MSNLTGIAAQNATEVVAQGQLMLMPNMLPLEVYLALGGYALLLTFIIILCRYDVLNNLKLLLFKKRGAKVLVHITQDGNMFWDVQTPSKERDKPQVTHEGKKQDWNTKAQLFAMRYGAPGALCVTGQGEIYNPFRDDKVDPYTAENIEQVAAYAELKGRLGVEKREDEIKKLLMIIILASVAAAGISFINMQAIGDVTTAIGSMNAAAAQLVAALKTIPQVL